MEAGGLWRGCVAADMTAAKSRRVAHGPPLCHHHHHPPTHCICSRMSVQTAAVSGRRIALVYHSFAVGRGLMAFLRDKVLTHADTVYICHVFSHQNPVGAGWAAAGWEA